jgi:DNA replication protein DnaC
VDVHRRNDTLRIVHRGDRLALARNAVDADLEMASIVPRKAVQELTRVLGGAERVDLHLFKSRDRLEALLQEATGQELSYADFLDQVLTEEVASKTAKHVTMRTQLARFPFVKGLDAFDFSYQPSLDKKQVQTLSTCHFIEHGENLVIGPPESAT